MVVKRYDVYWISLDPTQGSEIAKTRPCVVASPDDLNQSLRTVVVIPITSTTKSYPWRVECTVKNKNGWIATDQIHVMDKTSLGAAIGSLSPKELCN